MIIKPIDTEISVTTANTVYNSKLVRVYATANTIVTITDGEGTNNSFTVPSGSVTIVEKGVSDTLSGSAAILCTPISYKN